MFDTTMRDEEFRHTGGFLLIRVVPRDMNNSTSAHGHNTTQHNTPAVAGRCVHKLLCGCSYNGVCPLASFTLKSMGMLPDALCLDASINSLSSVSFSYDGRPAPNGMIT